MLSHAIHERRNQLGEYSHSGLVLSPEAVESEALIMRAWESAARDLESRLDQLDELAHGLLSDRRARP